MSPPPDTPIQRAQPHLGTLVSIAVTGLGKTAAHRAIDRGFAAIAGIHRLMSFHEPESELSRLNCEAANKSVQVHPDTFAVLSHALALSARTAGVFDVTIAPKLVATGFLPRPARGPAPRGRGSWRDIELNPQRRVRFRRPLWIDLGGIAKGYAVDRALAAMALPTGVQVVINAGGDLRVAGPGIERVLLRAPWSNGMAAVIELADGSLASSCGHDVRKIVARRTVTPYLDGSTRTSVGARRFVTVVAQECMAADALTKVVLALGRKSEPVLRSFGATAHVLTSGRGWLTLGRDT